MSKEIPTGGAGFIGLHLTEAMLRAGYGVWQAENSLVSAPATLDPGEEHVSLAGAQQAVLPEDLRHATSMFHAATIAPAPRRQRD